jgi:hypothetical protein
MKYDVNLKLIENNSMFNYSRNCWKLMCSRNCKSCLQAEDSILLLYLCNKNKKLDEIILTPLRKIDVEEFSCYLMIFLEKLSGFFANIKKDFINHFNDSLYIQLLFDKIKKDKKNELVFEIFWNLQYIKHSNKYCLLYDKFQEYFLNKINPFLKESILQQKSFVDYLQHQFTKPYTKELFLDISKYLKNFKKKYIKKVCRKFNEVENLPIITNPSLEWVKMNIKKIRIKSSASKPIIIPCIVRDKKGVKYNYEYMYKKDDLRKEKIIMNAIKLMDIIIKKELNLDYI